MNFRRISLHFLLALALVANAEAREFCGDLFTENFAGTRLEIQPLDVTERFSASASSGFFPPGVFGGVLDRLFKNKKRSSGFFPLESVAPDGGEVLIGIQKDGHISMMVDHIRYDGETFAGLANVREISSVSSGTILRFKNLPFETVVKLRENLLNLSRGQRVSLSCVHGIYSRLKEVGISLAGGEPGIRDSMLPSTLFGRFLRDGFVDHGGERIEYEIFRTSGAPELSKVQGAIRSQERAGASLLVLLGLLPTSAVVYFVYLAAE